MLDRFVLSPSFGSSTTSHSSIPSPSLSASSAVVVPSSFSSLGCCPSLTIRLNKDFSSTSSTDKTSRSISSFSASWSNGRASCDCCLYPRLVFFLHLPFVCLSVPSSSPSCCWLFASSPSLASPVPNKSSDEDAKEEEDAEEEEFGTWTALGSREQRLEKRDSGMNCVDSLIFSV